MSFKKVMQIVWTVFAFVFLVLMFFFVKSSSIIIERVDNDFVRINKITGNISFKGYLNDEKKFTPWINPPIYKEKK